MKSITAICCAALALGAAPAVAAPPSEPIRQPPGVENVAVRPPYVTGTVHSVVGIVQSAGDTSIGPVSGYVALDKPIKIKCLNANGCTIYVSASVDAKTSTESTDWAICPQIDGDIFVGSCHFYGSMSTSPNGVLGHVDGYASVPQGTHAVQSQVFFPDPSYVDHFLTVYTITTP